MLQYKDPNELTSVLLSGPCWVSKKHLSLEAVYAKTTGENYTNVVDKCEFIDVINSIKPQRILDVGCGIGKTCLQIMKENPSIKIVGFDFPFVIDYARKFTVEYPQIIFTSNWKVVFDTGPYDLVIMKQVAQHLEPYIFKTYLSAIKEIGKYLFIQGRDINDREENIWRTAIESGWNFVPELNNSKEIQKALTSENISSHSQGILQVVAEENLKAWCLAWTRPIVKTNGIVCACKHWDQKVEMGPWKDGLFWKESESFRNYHADGIGPTSEKSVCQTCVLEKAGNFSSSEEYKNLAMACSQLSSPSCLQFETPLDIGILKLGDFQNLSNVKKIIIGSIGKDSLECDVRSTITGISFLRNKFPNSELILQTNGQTIHNKKILTEIIDLNIDVIQIDIDGSNDDECRQSCNNENYSIDNSIRLANILYQIKQTASRKSPKIIWLYKTHEHNRKHASISKARIIAQNNGFDDIKFETDFSIEFGDSLSTQINRIGIEPVGPTSYEVDIKDFGFIADTDEVFSRLIRNTFDIDPHYVSIGMHGNLLEYKNVRTGFENTINKNEYICLVINHSDSEIYDKMLEGMIAGGKKILMLDLTDIEVKRRSIPQKLLILHGQTRGDSNSILMPYVPTNWTCFENLPKPSCADDYITDLFFAGQVQIERFEFLNNLFDKARSVGLKCDFRWSNSMSFYDFLSYCSMSKMNFDYSGFGLLCHRFFDLAQSGIPLLTVRNDARWFVKPPDSFFVEDYRELVDRTYKISFDERMQLGQEAKLFFDNNYSKEHFVNYVRESVKKHFFS